MRRSLSATGYLVADKQSKITPKISGKVVKLNFGVGDKVKKGDVLAVLESTTKHAQLDEVNASLSEAEREYNRQTALWKQGVTNRANLDSVEAQLKAARARVDQIRINMQDMTVRAPFDGTIATKNTEVGEGISSVTLGQVSGTLPAGAIGDDRARDCHGILLALPVNLISTGTINWQTFSEVAFNFDVDRGVALMGLILAVVSGVIGGFIPAASAARMPITQALREI